MGHSNFEVLSSNQIMALQGSFVIEKVGCSKNDCLMFDEIISDDLWNAVVN